ncbi:hypothetical protein AC578_5650 [Pseudocercospora eumusae]|uniref:Uncharacterized protein n=1 Tax=Pseudocercospora eumusae TaxID=321146 RepID=A0A139HTF9_9PEZI|nr:hypothetical protein AC578_5650 [Pseudocercospora eumusae]
MARMTGLVAFLLMTTAFASPYPALVARQIAGTCAASTCAATGRPEIQEGAACLCSAGTSFRNSICNGHPPLTSVFTTVPRTVNSPGTGDVSSPEITPSPTTNPALMKRQGYNCSPSSSWYRSYSSEHGAQAVRSACSCLRGGNESTSTTVVTRYSTRIASTQTKRSTSRSGTLTTRSTVLVTTTSNKGSTVISTETIITKTPAIIPVTGTTTITATRTTQVNIEAPSSFRLYYNLNGGRQYAVSATRPDNDDDDDTQERRFLSSSPSTGDTFTLDNVGRLIDTLGANAVAIATDQAPYKYLYLDRIVQNWNGPNVPRCTWCNGPLSCDYPDSGNSTASNSTNFYSCGGGFLVLSGSNAWVEGSSCQRVTIRLEVADGTTTTTDGGVTTDTASDATTTTDDSTIAEPTATGTDNPPFLRKYRFLG